MWSREPKQARIHSHHSSLRDRLHRHAKALEPTVNLETTKAVAWAVFQHHGGADGNRGHSNSHSQQHSMAVRRPSRFKIEAQMKYEIAHRSFTPFTPVCWDAGSTLFDSFELDSLLKTLDQATHPHTRNGEDNDVDDDDDDDAVTNARAVVLYQSPKQSHGLTQTRYPHEDEDEEEDDYVFTPKKRALEKPVKEVGHHNMWKSFLHSLHLDGFQKLQSQVTPHDVEKKQGRRASHKVHHSRDVDVDVQQRGQHHLWKLSFKAALKAREQDQVDLRSAWAAALKGTNLRDEPVHHHHHHHYQHHHHHHDEGEDYEMTIQAITKRAARKSLDETRRRVSMEFERSGLDAPRNSLDIDERDHVTVQPKALSLWDVFEL